MAPGCLHQGIGQFHPQPGQHGLTQLRGFEGAAGQPRWAEHQQPGAVALLELLHGLPERSIAIDAGQAAEGLEVVTDPVAVPALHRQFLQGAVVDHPLPAPPVTHQQPVGRPGWTGFRQPQLAEFAQPGTRIEHAEAASGGILHRHAGEGALELQQLLLIAHGPQAKPTQQHQPGATEARAAQQQQHAQADREERQQPAAGIGHLHPAALAAAHLPHQGLHDQTAIEGKPGQQVEQGQHQVEAAQFGDHHPQPGGHMGSGMAGCQQTDAQHQAHRRAGSGHQQRTDRRAALPLHAGHPPQQEEGDALHLHALAQGHQGMAQLVQQHRDKQQHGRDQAQGPQHHSRRIPRG